jgi:hypothetical protein
VYNATSGGCGCLLDCPEMICSKGFTSFYNSSTRACTCEPASDDSPTSVIMQAPPITSSIVKQLPPTSFPTSLPIITEVRVGPPMSHHTFQTSRASLVLPPFYATAPKANPPAATVPIAFPPASGTSCTDLYCISEMTPQFDDESGECECVWIPGLGPSGT